MLENSLRDSIRTSLPSFNLKESPRQTTLCPTRLAIQTSKATKSRSGSSGSKLSTWRSRNTDHPTSNATATRRLVTAASKTHAQSTATQHKLRNSASSAQGRPKVSTSPRYPQRRESRTVRPQRS